MFISTTEKRIKKMLLEKAIKLLEKCLRLMKENNIEIIKKIISTCSDLPCTNNILEDFINMVLKIMFDTVKEDLLEIISEIRLKFIFYALNKELLVVAYKKLAKKNVDAIKEELVKVANKKRLKRILGNNMEEKDLKTVKNYDAVKAEVLVEVNKKRVKEHFINAVNEELIKAANKKLEKRFLDAVKKKNLETVKKFLSNDLVCVNAQDESGNTGLMISCQGPLDQKSINMIQFFLNHPKIDVEAIDNYGNNALLFIVTNHKSKLFKKLVTQKSAIQQNIYGETPLRKAISFYHKLYIKYFQTLPNINVNAMGRGYVNMAAIHLAAREDIQIFKLVLEMPGVDINAQDSRGETPLMYTINFKNIENVKLLIEKNVNINIQNNNGETPLMIACNYSNKEIVELLLDQKSIDLNVRDNCGNTALYHATMRLEREKKNKMILKKC